jgi:hypothetical protein
MRPSVWQTTLHVQNNMLCVGTVFTSYTVRYIHLETMTKMKKMLMETYVGSVIAGEIPVPLMLGRVHDDVGLARKEKKSRLKENELN